MKMKVPEFWVALKRRMSNIFFRLCILGLRSHKRPQHIAYIVDGNRTFSRQHGIPLFEAYIRGMENIMRHIELNRVFGVPTLTFYLFSTHNNHRSAKDKQDVFTVIEIFLKKLVPNTNGYRYRIIGDVHELPVRIRSLCDQLTRRAKLNEGGIINLAINYSGRDEMIDVSSQLFRHPSPATMDERIIDNLMYTSMSAKPNIIIRTSGQKRLSDFLLWQSFDSMLYFTDRQWPEFSHWCLLKAVFHYQIFSRRCGFKNTKAEVQLQ